MTLHPLLSVIATSIATQIAVARNCSQIKRALGPILAREDDHLLRDIGLTRHDADSLMRDPGVPDPQSHTQMHMAAGTLCRSM